MNVILQKDVKHLGKAGDQVKVKKGYARNYLLPNKLVLVYNEARVKEWKHKKTVIEVKKKQALKARQEQLKKISEVTLTFTKEARDKGLLFGSVSAAEMADALEKTHKLLVDKKDIQTESLKNVGEFQIPVVLDSQNKTTLKVVVQASSPTETKKGFFKRGFFAKKAAADTKLDTEDTPSKDTKLNKEDASSN